MGGAAGRSRRVTIRTVADRAGVSPATVSMVLSRRPGWLELFRPETIDRVEKAAADLSYTPNLFALGMPAEKSPFFALVLHQMALGATDQWHHWGFEGALLEGVSAAAARHGVHPIVTTTHGEADQEDVERIGRIVDGGVFGSIVREPGSALTRLLASRHRGRFPLVVVFPKPLAHWPTNAVDVDNVAVGHTAGELLARRKRRWWLLVRYARSSDVHLRRCRGLAEAAREAKARIETYRLPLNVDESIIERLIARHLQRGRVDAIFAVDAAASAGSLRGVVRTERRPGEDIDLVGCDCAQWPGLAEHRLTALDVSWRRVGELALEQLVSQARGGERFDTILLKPRIVAGGTCPVPASLQPETLPDPRAEASSRKLAL